VKHIILIFTILLLGLTVAFAQNADVLKSDAIIQESQMQFLEAAKLYEAAAKAYEAENRIDAFSYFKAGQSYTKAKKYNLALLMLKKAEDNNYTAADLYLTYGDAYVGVKKIDEAEKVLLSGKAQYQEEWPAFTKKLAYLYYNSAQYQKAEIYLKTALQQAPNNHTYLYLLGSSYERMKMNKPATEMLEKVLALQPNHKNSIKKLGVIYFRQTDGLYSKETKRYELMKNPSRMDYHNSTKKLETIAQGYTKALPFLEKAHENSPHDKAIISCLSIAYRRLKMETEANKMTILLK